MSAPTIRSRAVDVVGTRQYDVALVVALALMIFAGNFKGTPLFAWFPIDLTAIGGVLGLFAVIIRIVAGGIVVRDWVPWVVVGAVLAPSLLVVTDHSFYELDKAISLIITAATVVIALELRDDQRRRFWVIAIVVVAGILAIGVLIFPEGTPYNGLAIKGSDTIAAGKIMGAALIVAFGHALAGRGRRRWALLAGSLVLAGFLIASGSRSALVAAVVGVILVGVLVKTSGRFDRLVMSIGLAVAAVVAIVAGGSAGAARIIGFLTGSMSATASREEVWNAAWRQIGSSPFSLTGVGWGSFYDILSDEERLDSGHRQYPHNMLLELWVEAGFLAVLGTVVLLGLSVWRLVILARRTTDWAVLLGVAVFATVSAMVSGDVNDNRLFWVSIAVAWTVDLRWSERIRALAGRIRRRLRRPGSRAEHGPAVDGENPGSG